MPPKKLKHERRGEKKESKFFGIFLVFSLLIVSSAALGVSYFALRDELPALYRSMLTRGWSKTEGRIIKTYNSTKTIRVGSAKNPGSATVYVPSVNYEFRVGNAAFTGSRINFSAKEKYFSLPEESTQYLDSIYRINQNVEVFYNPNDPQDSTLSREYVYEFGNYQAACCCGSIGVLFSLMLWLSIRDLIKIFGKQKNDDRK